jgi:hypothetical protein
MMVYCQSAHPLAFIALFGLLFVGCSSEPASDAPDAGEDVGDASADTPADACRNVPIASRVGNRCETSLDCVRGAECSVVDGPRVQDALCRQRCLPGLCDDVCADGEVCLPLAGDDAFGVCGPPAPGTQRSYEECSVDAGRCVTGLSCLIGLETQTSGVCLQSCELSLPCPTYNGRPARCLVDVETVTGTVQYCAPLCSTPGDEDECPPGMMCQTIGLAEVCGFF